jgi:poly-gamma-glutamate system protein
MKKLYWRPSRVSWQVYVLIALLAVAGMTAVEIFKKRVEQPYYRQKIRAARIMQSGMDVIREYRTTKLRKIAPIDPEVDPTNSGMIGLLISPITSNAGLLEAKQTTVNPNWAAVVVDMLGRAGVKRGDLVGMSLSGSFPGLNLAAYAAAESLNLKVVAITSVASSTWGANIPWLTWLDMERILNESRVLTNRSIAASFGGQSDRAMGMRREGKDMLKTAIERNKVRLISVKDEEENLDLRMSIYQECAEERPYAAFVNVGGGTVSVGTQVGKRFFRPGLNLHPPARALAIDSVMTRFAKEGVPVLHMRLVRKLAEEYGLPLEPLATQTVGQGVIFMKMKYREDLVAGMLAALILLLYAFIKMDIGYRVFSPMRKPADHKPPEPMI